MEEICERGGTGIYIHADVGVPEEIKHLFRTVAERLGSVDILINNAAISPKVPFEDIPLEQLEQVLRVNLMGGISLCTGGRGADERKRWGRIISLASMAGRFGAISPSALRRYQRRESLDDSKFGKDTGAVQYHCKLRIARRINTELTRVPPQKVQNEICSQIPLGRIESRQK